MNILYTFLLKSRIKSHPDRDTTYRFQHVMSFFYIFPAILITIYWLIHTIFSGINIVPTVNALILLFILCYICIKDWSYTDSFLNKLSKKGILKKDQLLKKGNFIEYYDEYDRPEHELTVKFTHLIFKIDGEKYNYNIADNHNDIILNEKKVKSKDISMNLNFAQNNNDNKYQLVFNKYIFQDKLVKIVLNEINDENYIKHKEKAKTYLNVM